MLGCIAAVFVGFVSFSASYRFGSILILFYYTSSKFTKLKEDYKKTLDKEYLVGGQRNWIQVLANSILATCVCILYVYLYGDDTYVSFGANIVTSFDTLGYSFQINDLKSVLLSVYVAHYGCACGDTWASELGILSKSNPRLVTTLFFREVPKGTNGGMSLLGTVASASGGLFIGFIFWFFSLFQYIDESRMYEIHLQYKQYPMILVGLISGLLGSLYDSILGATLQATYYSKDLKCIVKHNNIDIRNKSIQHITGINVLSNEMVNFISIVLTMITMAILSPIIFCALDNNQCVRPH